MKTTQPKRLSKCNSHEVLEKQLSITVKELIIVFMIVLLFFTVSLIMIPQTFGFL